MPPKLPPPNYKVLVIGLFAVAAYLGIDEIRHLQFQSWIVAAVLATGVTLVTYGMYPAGSGVGGPVQRVVGPAAIWVVVFGILSSVIPKPSVAGHAAREFVVLVRGEPPTETTAGKKVRLLSVSSLDTGALCPKLGKVYRETAEKRRTQRDEFRAVFRELATRTPGLDTAPDRVAAYFDGCWPTNTDAPGTNDAVDGDWAAFVRDVVRDGKELSKQAFALIEVDGALHLGGDLESGRDRYALLTIANPVQHTDRGRSMKEAVVFELVRGGPPGP